jgi:hypothetical protein
MLFNSSTQVLIRHLWELKTVVFLHLCLISGFKIEQRALTYMNKCWNTIITFYLEGSGGQNNNQYLCVVHFFNASVN